MSTRWYRTGTVTVTQGSVIVTGVDTQWTSQTVAGDLFTLDGSKIYEVASIESNTSLTLGSAITESSGSGLSYGIARNVKGRTTAELAGGVAQLIEEYESLADSGGGGKFADGTVAYPGITFTDDTNTGLYRIGADNLGVSCNGTKVMDIGATGVAFGAATGGKKAAGTVNAVKYYLNGTDISVASTTTAGLVELATDAETQTGTDTTRSICPASLKSTVPFKTTATMNLYVNSGAAYGSWGAGSDSNAGTQAAPLATIAAAIAKIPRFLEHAVTINLAGEPNYYEWKPDGTNGIKFTTGDSGVTVAVVSGSTLSVAISGSAVTITLATGGSTIAQIIAAIEASATVGPVICPIPVGTTSTNITAILSAQALTGGNVRTYAESVVLNGIGGGSSAVKGPSSTMSITLSGTAPANKAGVLIIKDFTADAIAAAESATLELAYLTVKHTGAALAKSGIALVNLFAKLRGIRLIGAFGNDSSFGAIMVCGGSIFAYYVQVYNAARAVNAMHGGVISFQSLYGGGNTIGLATRGGNIYKNGQALTGFANTAESATPAGTIL